MRRLCIVLAVLFAALWDTEMKAETTNVNVRELTESSALVFNGTIKALKRSNVENVKSSDSTMIVSIDEVLSQTPKAISAFNGLKGREVTVVDDSQTRPAVSLHEGQSATFFTNPLAYAENIAVSAKAILPAGEQPSALLDVKSQVSAAAEGKADGALAKQVRSADLVITGTVTQIRPLQPSRVQALAAVMGAKPHETVSEHDPKWKEAVVKVQSVEKGETAEKQVVILFPSSDDIMWRQVPKFQPGQAGTWLLHKGQVKDTDVANALLTPKPGERVEAYTTIHPEDFQPIDPSGKNVARVKRILSSH